MSNEWVAKMKRKAFSRLILGMHFSVLRGRAAHLFFEYVGKIILVGEAKLCGDLLYRKVCVHKELFGKVDLFIQNVGVGRYPIKLFKYPYGLRFRLGNMLTQKLQVEF